MKYFRTVILWSFALLFMLSCGNKDKSKTVQDEAFDLQSYIDAAEAVNPGLNSVDQVMDILDMVHAEYYDMLTNDPYSAHSYKTDFPIAAANLGIYMTDIIYHFFGEATEDMYLSFSAAQELAQFVGVESEFGKWTLERLEGTSVHKDTITLIFNQLLQDSEKYNSEKEMIFVHTAFLTGSFVQKVYITGNILQQKLMDEEISQEEEADIRKLLVIYLNQLNPSAEVLYQAFSEQQEQLEGLVILTTFERLKDLSEKLIELKPTLAVAPVSQIAEHEGLNQSIELVEELRSVLVTPQ